jgi:hypothetical protein
MSNASSRGRLGSIPADHDALGHPELRTEQGPPVGETKFQQIGPKTTSGDITKATPVHKSGDFKIAPGGGL